MTSGQDNRRRTARPHCRMLAGRSIGMKSLALLIALVGAGVMLYQRFVITDADENAQNDLYMPVADPILEPDRPDLIGESRDDE